MTKSTNLVKNHLENLIQKQQLTTGDKLPSVRQVAGLLGLSPLTVQRAFTELADIGFIRSQVGSGTFVGEVPLVARKLVAIISPAFNSDHSEHFSAQLIQGAEETLQAHNLRFILMHTQYLNIEREELKQVQEAISLGVDGLLVNLVSPPGAEVWQLLDTLNIPVVCMNNQGNDNLYSNVATNNFAGGTTAAQHLISLGHKHLAILAVDDESSSVQDRIRGFKHYLHNVAQLPEANLHVFSSAHVFKSEDMDRIALRLITGKLKATAFFAIRDDLAVRFIKILQKHKFVVPDYISVMGFDDNEICRYSSPTLTSVQQSSHQIGSRSAELLCSQFSQLEHPVLTRLLLTPSLVPRESTAAPFSDSHDN